MLKQIKTLGLSLVIGSMLVSAVPSNSFADNGNPVMTPEFILREYDIPEGETIMDVYGHIYDHNGIHIANEDGSPVEDVVKPTTRTTSKKDADIIVDIYTVQNAGKCSKEEEKMLRQYSKYRKIKKAAKEYYEQELQVYNDGYDAYPFVMDEVIVDADYYELFEKFDSFSFKRQQVIRTVFTYYYNKNAKFESTIQKCDECGIYFVTNKLAAMYGLEYNCGCEHGLPIPELTGAGLRAAWSRQDGVMRTNIKLSDITIIEETDELVVIECRTDIPMSWGEEKVERITYNKVTRTQNHIISGTEQK